MPKRVAACEHVNASPHAPSCHVSWPPWAPPHTPLGPCLLEVVQDVPVPRQSVRTRVGAAAERAAHSVVRVAQPRQQLLYLAALGLEQLQEWQAGYGAGAWRERWHTSHKRAA